VEVVKNISKEDVKKHKLFIGTKKLKEKKMKIAVTYENGKIYQHFGHTQEFKIYTIEDNKVVSSEIIDTNGHGHGALAGFLANQDVDVIICGGLGKGAQIALSQAGIQLYGGVQGEADEAVENFIKGTLVYNSNVQCNHHGEHHHGDHECGEHSCGEHHCHHE